MFVLLYIMACKWGKLDFSCEAKKETASYFSSTKVYGNIETP